MIPTTLARTNWLRSLQKGQRVTGIKRDIDGIERRGDGFISEVYPRYVVVEFEGGLLRHFHMATGTDAVRGKIDLVEWKGDA